VDFSVLVPAGECHYHGAGVRHVPVPHAGVDDQEEAAHTPQGCAVIGTLSAVGSSCVVVNSSLQGHGSISSPPGCESATGCLFWCELLHE
jgi:hypothetical protein